MQKLEDSMLSSRMLLSKSNDELSTENCNTTDNDFLHSKHINSNSNNFKNEVVTSFDVQNKLDDRSMNAIEKSDDKNTQQDAENSSNSMQIYLNKSVQNSNVMIIDDRRSDIDKLTQKINEPHDMYSTCNVINCNLSVTDSTFVRQNSESVFASVVMPNVQITSSKTCASNIKSPETVTNEEPYSGSSCAHSLQSPIIRNRFKNIYSVHTSTPSSLLRRSLVTNDYISTPNTNDDKSMSPITQSATKMTKAMQVFEC